MIDLQHMRALLDRDAIVLWPTNSYRESIYIRTRHRTEESQDVEHQRLMANSRYTWLVSFASNVDTREPEVVLTPWLTAVGEPDRRNYPLSITAPIVDVLKMCK